MTIEQITILVIIAATMGGLLAGRWRHDVVALAALLASVVLGLVPPGEAFAGFGHPAVITVACVLVLSQGLKNTGVVDALARRVVPQSEGPLLPIAALVGTGAVLSALMNNVGAMALLLPLALQAAARHELPPGRILMPLSFATMLGGMTTLIGTPPNLIVAAFRAETGRESFAMFDYTPVGVTVALAGIAFIVLIGWRLVPRRSARTAAGFDTGKYLTEARVRKGGRAAGLTVREVERELERSDAQIVGMVRNQFRIYAPSPGRALRTGDILVIEAEPDSLASVLGALGLDLEEDVEATGEAAERDAESPDQRGESGGAASTPAQSDESRKDRESTEVGLQELVVMPASTLIGRSARDIALRSRYGINLLAISRQGRRSIRRLRSTRLQVGDVLLMQGGTEAIAGFAADHACAPLAERAIRIPDRGRGVFAVGVMAAAIAVAAFGVLPAAITFAAAVVAFMVRRIVPPTEAYAAIDWSVIVLLAALLPVAGALESTGTADLVAHGLLDSVAADRPIIAVVVILAVSMTMSDFVNNAATAAVMCPIAISTAAQLGVNADPFLMAVAVGASCAFLTPIGHQNNTLILGPAGFRFGDYWRLGLPMELLVIAVGVPALITIWPL
ncbi:MAG TPA: SLC13 family permease [Steroidobacteraceae bacterium]|nr:SLC13 family permease [Steroidobacteraceae bacterium]